MEELPEDLWIEILVNVPAISVRGFRRVSRFFKELIDSPEFIRKHNANLSSSIKSERSKFLIHMELDSISGMKLDSNFTNVSSYLSPPEGIFDYDIVGCCQGILALRLTNPEGLLFWNPLTRSCQRLDVPEPEGWRYYVGHDSVSDDLKLLKICNDHDFGICYSSKTGSWKGINIGLDIRYFNSYHCSDVVEGSNAIHIVAREFTPDRRSIVAFDLSTDEFNMLPLPEHVLSLDINDIEYLTSLDGCLCFHVHIQHDLVVWRMNQYGSAESWSELLRISQSPMLVALDFVNHRREVLLITFLRTTMVIYSYNMGKKELIQRATAERLDSYLSMPRLYSPSLRPATLEFYKTDIVM